MVWGITSNESHAQVSEFVDQYGLSFPVLLDTDGSVKRQYDQMEAFVTAAYPKDWVIGNSGHIIYKNNHFALDAMVHAIESQL